MQVYTQRISSFISVNASSLSYNLQPQILSINAIGLLSFHIELEEHRVI